MQELDSPDRHYLSAAVGWYELGNITEAAAEWERLSPEAKRCPDALEVRWLILVEMKNWDEAVKVAEAMIAAAPDSCAGWLHRSYALRRASHGGLEKAWAALRPAAEKFPRKALVAYNLSCYATQMGRLDEGWEWFLRAIQISPDASQIRQMALCDDDLTPLWERIRGLR